MQTIQTIGAFEAKTHFSALLQKVEQGEQVIITKHGHPIAKLIPAKSEDPNIVKKAIKALKAFGKKHALKKLNWKVLRDEGRRFL